MFPFVSNFYYNLNNTKQLANYNIIANFDDILSFVHVSDLKYLYYNCNEIYHQSYNLKDDLTKKKALNKQGN